MDAVKVDADTIYSLVNHLPAFDDPNIKSLQIAWGEQREILVEAVKQLKLIAAQKPVSVPLFRINLKVNSQVGFKQLGVIMRSKALYILYSFYSVVDKVRNKLLHSYLIQTITL